MQNGASMNRIAMGLAACVAFGVFDAGPAHAQNGEPSDARALGAEAAGGVAGSLAGVAVGLAISRPDRCGVDDLECTIKGLGAAGIGSVVGATLGSVLMGRSVRSQPSGIGAFVGSVAGAFAGVGLVHAMTEEANLKLEKPLTVAVYSITQGIITALGSRAGAALR